MTRVSIVSGTRTYYLLGIFFSLFDCYSFTAFFVVAWINSIFNINFNCSRWSYAVAIKSSNGLIYDTNEQEIELDNQQIKEIQIFFPAIDLLFTCISKKKKTNRMVR